MNNIILDKFNAGEPCVGTLTHLLSPTALRAMTHMTPGAEPVPMMAVVPFSAKRLLYSVYM